MLTDSRTPEVEALCQLAHECSRRGWVPATSGNFSLREVATGRIFISRSGLDKGRMTADDLLGLNSEGRVHVHVQRGAGKPSAETRLHVVVYDARPEAHAIAHVHTIWNTLLSMRFMDAGRVEIAGYELLKALCDVRSHTHRETVPIIANSQDYHTLARELEEALDENPLAHGVLLAGHGLYTWGKTVADARRHVEALEFLFEVECRRLMADAK
jgi:methylthioribulose-1-phosphate dehydratase